MTGQIVAFERVPHSRELNNKKKNIVKTKILPEVRITAKGYQGMK